MILGEVDFPSQLVDAAIEGKLVIFAGAGVSMGAPANLPSFEQLAGDIANGFGKEPKKPLDQFLGSLSPEELVIQKAAISSLEEINSKPKYLHQHLLNLFPSSEKVRIVTTNFDPLFTDAADLLWSTKPEIFTAPALPIGDDFEGIVHIHGANTHPKSIIITDRGFGKAYLADGWASRFLVKMFEAYTVLFVGYSHDDVVMSYLARALPDKAQGKRFALEGKSQERNQSKWRSLGITPVYFPQQDVGDYTKLDLCTLKLAEFLSRQPSDWQTHIGFIAEQDGPLDIVAEHTIQHALKDISKVRYFTSKASSEKWAFWLYEQKVLEPLFRRENVDEISLCFESWLLNTFVCSKPEVLFELIAKERHQISSRLWFNLVRTIHTSENVSQLKQWIDLLLHLCPHHPNIHGLQFLATEASKSGMRYHVLRLFFKLAKRYVRINQGIDYSSANKDPIWKVELDIHSPHWNLNEVWQKLLKPEIQFICKDLLNKGCLWFKDTLESRSVWMKRISATRIDSWSRSAIEEHEQDSDRRAIDVVIHAMRDCIEACIDTDPAWATRWCIEHLESDNVLVSRIAVHGLRKNKYLSAATKLNWGQQCGIDKSDLRHEIFELIRELYPNLGGADRHQLIHTILKSNSSKEDLNAEQQAFESWQWLYVLHQADENCELLKIQMNALKRKYPDLTAREYPDLNMWHSSILASNDLNSPWSVTELLGKQTNDWFEEIKKFKPQQSAHFDRWHLIQVVQQAAIEQPTWALKFCLYLENIKDWENDLWPSLIASFNKWPSDDSSIHQVISILSLPGLYQHHPRAVVKALEGHLKCDAFDSLSEVHHKANGVVLNIWKSCSLSQAPLSGDTIDWITQSINTLEGEIASYWISALDIIVKLGQESQYTEYLDQISALVNTENPKTIYTIPLVSRQINFLYHVNAQWTIERLLPLLNPSVDQAKQAWDGLFTSGGIQAASFASVKPYFEKMRERLFEILPGKEDIFIDHYVAVAFWHIEDPHIEWLPQILNNLSAGHRSIVARKLYSHLSGKPAEARVAVWRNWLKDYWLNRINGRPLPLDAQEAGAMLGLLGSIPELFDELVEVAIQMPAPDLRHSHLVYSLNNKDWAVHHSNSLAKLITYLLKAKEVYSEFFGLDGLLLKINTSEVSEDILEQLNQALISTGQDKLCFSKSTTLAGKTLSD
ncbi:DUF4020 domain-containing protein [Thalassotalea ponticola]|uniref:DUF4020 domain-containing protein n=1 Tax=Thalassotalea ponticola TaxID=1523392 RepID=UPI0025B3A7E5|nr:DUF4020 domain-containing protein [Thalassotalea ponticola]MDN3652768.1 DUF4020 domain-containing protein [Thalassotalea ponticola]